MRYLSVPQRLMDASLRRTHLDGGRIYRALETEVGNEHMLLIGTRNEMPHNTRDHRTGEGRDRDRCHRDTIEAVVNGEYLYYLISKTGVVEHTEAEYLAQPHITNEDMTLTDMGPRGLIA